jgi:hypothetical protein
LFCFRFAHVAFASPVLTSFRSFRFRSTRSAFLLLLFCFHFACLCFHFARSAFVLLVFAFVLLVLRSFGSCCFC